MAPVISLGLYTVITIWAWPLANQEDGKKLPWCYCFMPSYYREEPEDENRIPLLPDSNSVLLEEEMVHIQ